MRKAVRHILAAAVAPDAVALAACLAVLGLLRLVEVLQ